MCHMFLGRSDGYIVNLQCAAFWMMKGVVKGCKRGVGIAILAY